MPVEPKSLLTAKTPVSEPVRALRLVVSLVYILAGVWQLLLTTRPVLGALFGYDGVEFLPDVWDVRGYTGLTGALLVLVGWWLFPDSKSKEVEGQNAAPDPVSQPRGPAGGSRPLATRILLGVLSMLAAVFGVLQLTGHGPLATGTSGTLSDGMHGVDLGGLLLLACAWWLFPEQKRPRIASTSAQRADVVGFPYVLQVMQVLCIALLGTGLILFQNAREEWASQRFFRSRWGNSGDFDIERIAGPAFAGSVCVALLWILFPWRERYTTSTPGSVADEQKSSSIKPAPGAMAVQAVLHALAWALLAAGIWQFARFVVSVVTEDVGTFWIQGIAFMVLALLLFRSRKRGWRR